MFDKSKACKVQRKFQNGIDTEKVNENRFC